MEQISKCSHGGIRGAAVDVSWRRLQPWRTLSGAGPGSELQPMERGHSVGGGLGELLSMVGPVLQSHIGVAPEGGAHGMNPCWSSASRTAACGKST